MQEASQAHLHDEPLVLQGPFGGEHKLLTKDSRPAWSQPHRDALSHLLLAKLQAGQGKNRLSSQVLLQQLLLALLVPQGLCRCQLLVWVLIINTRQQEVKQACAAATSRP